jgi:hypothetical protein
MSTESVIQCLWTYSNVLHDDGTSCGDYIEQHGYLLFLRMEDENINTLDKPRTIPAEYN